jgi:hypothetical protein
MTTQVTVDGDYEHMKGSVFESYEAVPNQRDAWRVEVWQTIGVITEGEHK